MDRACVNIAQHLRPVLVLTYFRNFDSSGIQTWDLRDTLYLNLRVLPNRLLGHHGQILMNLKVTKIENFILTCIASGDAGHRKAIQSIPTLPPSYPLVHCCTFMKLIITISLNINMQYLQAFSGQQDSFLQAVGCLFKDNMDWRKKMLYCCISMVRIFS